jgi:hypothetical protein
MIRNIGLEFLESGAFSDSDLLDTYKPEDVTADPEQLAQGLFSFQLALTMNMVSTAEAAVEQIDTCLKMAKFFQFHLRQITDASHFQAGNVDALVVFNQVRDQALQNAQGYLEISMQIFKELHAGSDSAPFARLRAVGNGLTYAANSAHKNLGLADTYVELSRTRGYNIFPQQYNDAPLLPDEKIGDRHLSLRKEFKAGQEQLVGVVDDALGIMLSRIRHIREVVIPAAPYVTAKWEEDIDYNFEFINGLMGWQEMFSRISDDNDKFMQGITPQSP